MGSVYTPRLYGERTPERVLEVLEDWIDWHAYRLAELAPGQVDNLYYQDLAQEGRLAVYRLLERDPHIWAPKLLRLAILSMYAARRRGRSVLRTDPHHRLRTYEQVSWEMLADGADGVEDSGVRSEVVGWRIVGDANDGAWGVWNWPRKIYLLKLEITYSLTRSPVQKQPGCSTVRSNVIGSGYRSTRETRRW